MEELVKLKNNAMSEREEVEIIVTNVNHLKESK
jgi:hypothetical protein